MKSERELSESFTKVIQVPKEGVTNFFPNPTIRSEPPILSILICAQAQIIATTNRILAII